MKPGVIMCLYYQIFGSLGLGALMLGGLLVLSKEGVQTFSKAMPFECGFIPLSGVRAPFSVQFFLVALVFLVFDVEVVLLYPVACGYGNIFFLSASAYGVFLAFLAFGFAWEWSQGSLEWLKSSHIQLWYLICT